MSSAAQEVTRFLAICRRRARTRRAFRALLGALAIVAAAMIVIAILAGLLGLEWNPTKGAVLTTLALVPLAAATVAWCLPLRELPVVGEADRNLDLDHALVTAHEFASSTEPLCRDVCRRAAATVEAASPRVAVPIRLPVYHACAVSLLVAAAWLVGVRGDETAKSPTHASPATAALSRDLQDEAARLVEQHRPGDQRLVEARGLLEIDERLRRGEIDADAARTRLELVSGKGLRAAAPGSERPGGSNDPVGKPASTERKPTTSADRNASVGQTSREPGRVFAGTSGSAGAGGVGAGAGEGSNARRASTTVNAGDSRGTGEWVLPIAPKASWQGGRGATSGPGMIHEGSRTVRTRIPLISPSIPMTASEKRISTSYLRALSRTEDAETEGPR